MNRSVANRDFVDFRKLLHAMKGSAASIGAEHLARICSDMNVQSDAELRLQASHLVDGIQKEFDAARAELDRYIQSRRRTAG